MPSWASYQRRAAPVSPRLAAGNFLCSDHLFISASDLTRIIHLCTFCARLYYIGMEYTVIKKLPSNNSPAVAGMDNAMVVRDPAESACRVTWSVACLAACTAKAIICSRFSCSVALWPASSWSHGSDAAQAATSRRVFSSCDGLCFSSCFSLSLALLASTFCCYNIPNELCKFSLCLLSTSIVAAWPGAHFSAS